MHIPGRLLAAVDRRAKALKVNRNRLIVRALEREVLETAAWSPEFLDALRDVDAETAGSVDDLLEEVRQRRRSKTPPSL